MAALGMRAAAAAALIFHAATDAGAPPTPATFNITTSTPSNIVPPRFVSMSFGIEQMKGNDPWGWFSPNRTRVALAALAPAFLRVSGTAVDSLIFQESGPCTISEELDALSSPSSPSSSGASCLNASEWTTLLTASSGAGLDLIVGINGRVGKNSTSPDAPWDSANAQTFFAWLAATVEASNGTLKPPAGYELGNEPDLWHNFFSTPVNGSALAADLPALQSLISAHPSLGAPYTVGPDTCECWHGDDVLHDYAAALPPTLLSNHMVTFHFYNGGGTVEPSFFTTPAVADRLAAIVLQTRSRLANTAAADLPLIIGETGECVMGGCAGPPENTTTAGVEQRRREQQQQQQLAEADNEEAAAAGSFGEGVGGGPPRPYWSPDYIDGFLFLDKLGMSAALNISSIFREKVLGGNDGFFDVLARPSASYWPMLAHKLLMGGAVLSVENSTSPGRLLRVYAHCARAVPGGAGGGLVPEYPPGAVALLYVNYDNTTSYALDLGASLPSAAPRDEYSFSGHMPAGMPGNDTECVWGSNGGGGRKPPPYLPGAVCLNGALLYMSDGPLGANSTMPRLVPRTVTDPTQPIVVAPVSYGFVVLTGANAPACVGAGWGA